IACDSAVLRGFRRASARVLPDDTPGPVARVAPGGYGGDAVDDERRPARPLVGLPPAASRGEARQSDRALAGPRVETFVPLLPGRPSRGASRFRQPALPGAAGQALLSFSPPSGPVRSASEIAQPYRPFRLEFARIRAVHSAHGPASAGKADVPALRH